ncbi:DUF3892 domain-containing protein [Candidatus Soleaferrea massiliensis]|uniref:DUF3892 domain-containing protein n=1 Tax=Candidatus Soleaferrea massiliensis TaxID=1470354 RepID=UPI00058DDC73|nr:DUF3892 domain-containing protein [Candidatus Soleaferrea massiliensis]
MEYEKNIAQNFVTNAGNFEPVPKPNAQSITAVVRTDGKITGYELSGGDIVSKEEGILRARNGDIKGVTIAHRRGSEYLRSLPDQNEENNLGSLPSISQQGTR